MPVVVEAVADQLVGVFVELGRFLTSHVGNRGTAADDRTNRNKESAFAETYDVDARGRSGKRPQVGQRVTIVRNRADVRIFPICQIE